MEDKLKMLASFVNSADELRLSVFRSPPVEDSIQFFPDDECPVLVKMLCPGDLANVTRERDLYEPVIFFGNKGQIPDGSTGRDLCGLHCLIPSRSTLD